MKSFLALAALIVSTSSFALDISNVRLSCSAKEDHPGVILEDEAILSSYGKVHFWDNDKMRPMVDLGSNTYVLLTGDDIMSVKFERVARSLIIIGTLRVMGEKEAVTLSCKQQVAPY